MKASSLATALSASAAVGALTVNPLLEKDPNFASNSVWDEVRHLAATDVDIRSRPCSSALYDWAKSKARTIGFSNYARLTDPELNIPQLIYVYKHYVDGSGDDEYFGSDSKFTNELLSRHRETENFWKRADNDGHVLNPDDILLMGMHGNDLKKMNNVIDAIKFMFPDISNREARQKAASVQNLIEDIPGMYDNPMLTLNAIAATGVTKDGTAIPDALLIGDGLLEFLSDQDLGKDGPDFIHAHEFSHHLQFLVDLDFQWEALGKGNANRRVELMADAFGSYFLTHEKGGSLNKKRVSLLNDIAFSIGDCSKDSKTHHGTPLQRECAAIWGSNLAMAYDSPIIHPKHFRKLFDDALPGMLSLDEDVCVLGLEENSTDSTIFAEEEEENAESLSSPFSLPLQSPQPTQSPLTPSSTQIKTDPTTSQEISPLASLPTRGPTEYPTKSLSTYSPTHHPSRLPGLDVDIEENMSSSTQSNYPTNSSTTVFATAYPPTHRPSRGAGADEDSEPPAEGNILSRAQSASSSTRAVPSSIQLLLLSQVLYMSDNLLQVIAHMDFACRVN